MDIALTLKNLRIQRGLSQYRLAKISGVSQSIISSIESGSREPTLSVLERLCAHMDIQLSTFFALATGENIGQQYMPPMLRKFSQLDDSDQKIIEAMVDSLYLKSHGTVSSECEKNSKGII